ncbi:hypothetical protein RUND412_007036 [Rhizina undulata]
MHRKKATGLPVTLIELYTVTHRIFIDDYVDKNVREIFERILWGFLLIVYGAVHLTAWNAHFPTQTEQWMWRASSLNDRMVSLLGFSLHCLWCCSLDYLERPFPDVNRVMDVAGFVFYRLDGILVEVTMKFALRFSPHCLWCYSLDYLERSFPDVDREMDAAGFVS